MLHTKYTRLHQIEIIATSIAITFIGVMFMIFLVMCFA